MSDLRDITILITSFLRAGYLQKCLEGIVTNLPECKILIVDDSDGGFIYPHVEGIYDDQFVALPFDSGLSAKRNAGVKAARTKYILLGCDDFDFSTRKARRGIEIMLYFLDVMNNVDVVGGRVNGNPYEGFLEYVPGEYIRETRLDTSFAAMEIDAAICDLTVNYFLGRAEVMKQFPWPQEMKIGGEHVCFFLDLKLAGRRVAWVNGANITTLKLGPEAQHPDYANYRARARTLGHPLMMKRYKIREYISF